VWFAVFSCELVFAKGKTEEELPQISPEYVLCATPFDTSSLAPSDIAAARVFERTLVENLQDITARIRNGSEIRHYSQTAWFTQVREAETKLAQKRAERDKLFFEGYPKWKYKKERKAIDKEIAQLNEALKAVKSVEPLASSQPAFRVVVSASKPADEEELDAFLDAQKADGYLAGTFSTYYGRMVAEIKIRSKYGAFSWDDSVIFSSEDMTRASDELAVRLEEAVSGTKRASVTIRTLPDDALVLVNGELAKSGEEVRVNPGEVSVTVQAHNYESATETFALAPDAELEEELVLAPVTLEALRITLDYGKKDVPAPSKVYLGALYIGDLPAGGSFDFEIPDSGYSYLSAETEDGKTARVIVMGNHSEDEVREIAVKPRRLPKKDEKPVEKRRRQFYGAWGRLWVSLPVAFLINGFYNVYVNSFIGSGLTSETLYNGYKKFQYATWGAYIVTGIFGIESIIRLVVYISAANKQSVQLEK
jgi:hypothetical protein